jgi:putative phosphoribosyl transferase
MGQERRKSRSTAIARHVAIPFGPWQQVGELSVPPEARGVVLFASDSESDEADHAQDSLAKALQQGGFATLILEAALHGGDPAPSEAGARQHYQIHQDVQRLLATTDWLASTDIASLPIGLLGVGVGGPPALHAAAARRAQVRAVVIVGGGADFVAGDLLHLVEAPTMCITTEEHRLRPSMIDRLQCEHRHDCVTGPHPLRGEQAIAHTCELAGQWFRRHLSAEAKSKPGAWAERTTP